MSTPKPLNLGAHVEPGGVRVRAFAMAERCAIRLFGDAGEVLSTRDLEPRGHGIFEGFVAGLGHADRYGFVVDGRDIYDPWARWLPEGVHRPAAVYAPQYEFQNGLGTYRPLEKQIFYELHVGTFTPEGTFAAAATRLGELARLGVTTIELMPVTAFAGSRGWGYDTVAHFAPHPAYGTPDDLRALVDAAHGHGLGVVLDVVYNHFGPSGNYLHSLDRDLFLKEESSPWGELPNFRHFVMRAHVLESAMYFLRDVRFDGLRIDATHAIVDRPEDHILKVLAQETAGLIPKKDLIAEDDRGEPALYTEQGMTAIWADDFHHEVHVTLTHERDGYYAKHQGGAAAIAKTIEAGWTRGKPAPQLPAHAFLYAIQNHDQVGNRPLGDRLGSVAGVQAFRAASALLLFLPMTPLLFMGQEWGELRPFLYFTDHDEELGAAVTEGRKREFSHFEGFSAERAEKIPDPQLEATFQRSKLDWTARTEPEHRRTLAIYHDLLSLRHQDPVIASGSRDRLRASARGDVLVVERWNEHGRRILHLNFAHVPAEVGEDVARAQVVLSTADSVDPTSLAPWEARIVVG